jgi:hypothetical protein
MTHTLNIREAEQKMVTRAEIELINQISQEKERFADSDFWMTPEENLRLSSLGIKEKADLKDTIAMHVLEFGVSEAMKLCKYEFYSLEKLRG